jgi:hypothetical protein
VVDSGKPSDQVGSPKANPLRESEVFMSVQRKDDRHSDDPVKALKSLFDDTGGAADTEEPKKGPQMKIVGDLRQSAKKKR